MAGWLAGWGGVWSENEGFGERAKGTGAIFCGWDAPLWGWFWRGGVGRLRKSGERVSRTEPGCRTGVWRGIHRARANESTSPLRENVP